MIARLGRVADAFWRASAYCLHPRVIALSLAPLLLSAGLAFALGWFYWGDAVGAVRATLDAWQLIDTLLHYLNFIGADDFRAALAPIVLLVLAVPVAVIVTLLFVAVLMSPALVRMVAARRFRALERLGGGAAWWRSLAWSLGHGLFALLLLILSLPLWLIPPLVLVIPPLIWGWLGYRVFAYDALAHHASVAERRALLREHRVPLLFMGVVSGYASTAPAAIWALGGIAAIALAPLLITVSIWLYTVVFAFTTLWFAHYALASLAEMRAREVEAVPIVVAEDVLAAPQAEPVPLAPAPPLLP